MSFLLEEMEKQREREGLLEGLASVNGARFH